MANEAIAVPESGVTSALAQDPLIKGLDSEREALAAAKPLHGRAAAVGWEESRCACVGDGGGTRCRRRRQREGTHAQSDMGRSRREKRAMPDSWHQRVYNAVEREVE